MTCEFCGMAKASSNEPCIFCGRSPAARTTDRQLPKDADYISHPRIIDPHPRFRSKPGFPVESGVLPARPVPTDSAAIPLASAQRRAGASAHEKPGMMPLTHNPATGKPAPGAPAAARMPVLRNKLARQLASAAGIVVAVTGLGFGTAWWLNEMSYRELVAARQAPAAMVAPAPAAQMEKPGYVPPAAPPKQVLAAAAAAAAVPAAGLAIADAERPETLAPRSALAALALENPPVAVAAPARAAPRAADAPAAVTASTPEATPAPMKNLKKPKKRYTELARKERTEEMERLQTQAFSETTRERIGAAPNRASPLQRQSARQRPARVAQASRNALGQCQQLSNFFRREQCKWQVCDGRWGRNGCPAYARNDSAIF
ncbi:MAG: hypothetical protein JWQ23_1816 [Herminiimonas sp.]|nr:hypothetical protein [Herminiimonas sp.]